jgi:hypothetical protein
VNVNGKGSVMTPDGGMSIVLSGPNNGSGLGGSTELMSPATGAALVEFDWSYSTLDDPGFELAGYILGAQFFELSSTNGDFGIGSISAMASQNFGFAVVTIDNTGAPGILTISNFDVVPGSDAANTPEPGTLTLLPVGLAILFVCKYQKAQAGVAHHNRTSMIPERTIRKLGEHRGSATRRINRNA